MKNKFTLLSAFALATGFSAAEGLYYIGSEAQESMPLKWVVGANVVFDDNVNPGYGAEEDATSINPYVGCSFVNMTPQTTWDVYGRIGAVYYFDEPTAAGSDDLYTQFRAGVNLTHRFSELLRFSSRNFIAYELEPDYSYGFATTRQVGEYLYWQTDNSLGYSWTPRLGTYTGFTLTGLQYDDVRNSDRFTWAVYQQFRYLLNPQQTVLTLDYRYADTTADDYASDSTDHYITVGIEHRFSPNTIVIARAGAQFHDVDLGSNSAGPYAELTLNSRVTEQFTVKAFGRLGYEPYDTVQAIGFGLYDFDQRQAFRIGITGEYAINQTFTIFGGVDYIPANFDDGRLVSGVGPATAGGYSEDLINLYIGLSAQINEHLFATASYNFTDSSSDFAGRDYERNRISLGLRYEF